MAGRGRAGSGWARQGLAWRGSIPHSPAKTHIQRVGTGLSGFV